MSLRKLVLAGLVSAAIVVACGSDPKPTEPCQEGRPDFELLIKAAVGPLPEDLVVRLEHGAGEEEYVLANPGTPVVLFCDPSDREGNVIDGGAPHAHGGAGAGGAGGEGGAPSGGPVDALFCRIWSFGSARIEVETLVYPMVEPLDLTHEKDVCTGQSELELEMPDGGMMR